MSVLINGNASWQAVPVPPLYLYFSLFLSLSVSLSTMWEGKL